MKKYLALLGTLLALLSPVSHAAPIGWYELSATWNGGQFNGRFHYDSASPYQVTQVEGLLADTFQTTQITTVWNLANGAAPDEPLFLHNSKPAAEFGYDAGFYLALVDLGATLGIDTGADNSLYDWSDFPAFELGELNGVALTGWEITPAGEVPEPGSLAVLGLGLLGCFAARRRHP